jgi:uncharacterized protein (DUF362 family)/NAD-dependent dihydropyrimidine dehydrogenase PreA subunit
MNNGSWSIKSKWSIPNWYSAFIQYLLQLYEREACLKFSHYSIKGGIMSEVIIKQCDSYDIPGLTGILNSGMELLGGWDGFVSPGMKVLLKVNLIGPKTSDSAAVTHCEFVRAIVRILKGKQCTVWIGDSSGGAIAGIAPTARSFSISGLEKVAAEEGAVIKNFDREGAVEAVDDMLPFKSIYLAKPMFDADVIINLPKLKTHMSGIYTGAVKNLFGCIPGLRKAEYHRLAPDTESFGQVIAEINTLIKPVLHIMDGVTAMQGEGPTAGSVYNAGKILISRDPLALDAIALKMLGLDIKEIPILKAAIERGLGEYRPGSITVKGDFITPPKLENFKLPKRLGSNKKQNSKFLIKIIDFFKARPNIDTKQCKGCNVCVESCPVQAIDKPSKKIDYSKCIECMCCHELCMHKAVHLKNENILAGLASRLFNRGYK